MICTSIQNKTYDEILALLDDPWIEMAEIRLDRCDLSDEEIEDLFANTDTPLIATCRIVEVGATAPGPSVTSARAPVISPLENELPIPCADRPLWTSPG